MTMDADKKFLLNHMNSTSIKVGLGDLIEAAGSPAATLTDGKILIGDAADLPAEKNVSGAATMDRDGVLTLAADVIADASFIADDAVSLEHLDDGIAPSHVVKFAGLHTTVGGGAAEVKAVAGVLSTDIVVATLAAKGATPRTIVTAEVSDDDELTFTFSGDPSTDHVVTYVVLRAAA